MVKVVNCEVCGKKISKLPKHARKERGGTVCNDCYLERHKKENEEMEDSIRRIRRPPGGWPQDYPIKNRLRNYLLVLRERELGYRALEGRLRRRKLDPEETLKEVDDLIMELKRECSVDFELDLEELKMESF